jgi:hypothetical protein
MITTIIILATALIITIVLLVGALLMDRIDRLKEQIIALDKEQHIQNKDIIELIEYRQQSSEMLLQHIEILKYLVEKDPVLTKSKWEA